MSEPAELPTALAAPPPSEHEGPQDGSEEAAQNGTENEISQEQQQPSLHVKVEDQHDAPPPQDAPVVAGNDPANDAASAQRGASKSDRHVAFDPEVHVASVVFHKEKTQQEIEDEMDVFERLYYAKPVRQAAPPVNPNTTAAAAEGSTIEATGEVAAEGGGASKPEGENGVAPATVVTAPQPTAQKGRHVLPPPSVERRLAAELGECSFKPQITSIAKEHRKIRNWEHFVQLQTEWSSQQARKNAENLKKLNISDGVGQLFDEIKRTHSKKIITYLEKQHLYKSPQQAYKNGKTSALRSFMHQHDAQSNKGSSSYHRDPITTDGTIFQRLHEEATVRDATIRVMEQTMIEKEARELFRPTTNESYWRASTMLGARTPSRSLREAFSGGHEDSGNYDDIEDNEASYFDDMSAPIEEELLAKGEEYRRRLEARQNASVLQKEVHSFKPVMNPNSRRILLRKALEHEMDQDEEMWFGDEEHHRSAERDEAGYYSHHPHRAAAARTVSHNSSEELILERRKDSQKPKATFDAEVFTARMQRRDVDRAQKLSALRRSLKLEEVSECTFRPSISQKSNVSAQRQRGGLSYSPQSKTSQNSSTPKAYISQIPVESFSPEEVVRAPVAQSASVGRRPEPVATRKAPVSNNDARQHMRQGAQAHHDGDAYLQNLEDELRGVIAEWTTISATTTS